MRDMVYEPLRSLVEAFVDGAVDVRLRYGDTGYRERWAEHDFPIATLTALQDWLAAQGPNIVVS